MPAKPAPLILAPPEKIRQLAEMRERLRAQEAEQLRHADVFGLLEYEPTPKQQLFHDATEFDVLFGGSSGGGKSTALVAHAIRECVRYPGIRVGAFRRSYPELKESLLAELSTTFRFAGPLGAKWNGNEYELRFPNGSVIMFRYAETLKDATRRQGGQFQLLVFDERTLAPADVIAVLESRLRSGRADIPVLGIRSSANPGGAGHGTVKARYITATNFGRDVVTDERGRTVRFIPSKLSDNPHVNPEYAADLQALPEKLRAAFLDGNWDVFSGQMFPELSRDRHVIDPVHLPESWARYCGIDWGYANPWAVLHAALDEDGRAWFYREHYAAGVGEADQARRILASEAEGERISARYADDAMWASRGDARSVADVYSQNGCHLTRAAKGSRVIGWQRVRSYLAEAPACPHHRAMGWETCPKLHMFSTLRNFYRTLTDLPHAESGDPEDADTHGDDHLPDAARYLLINLGGGAQSWIDWAKRKAELAAAGPPDLAMAAHRARLANPGPDLAKCRKPDCDRLVSAASAYCCVPCTEAAAGQYEIHAHSAGCDERAAERGVPVAVADPEAPLSPAEQLRRARTAAYRAQQGR